MPACGDLLFPGQRRASRHRACDEATGGFMMAKLLRSVRRTMLNVGFPAALSKVKVDDNLRSEGVVTSG
jgi:hypothetical protein